MKIIRLAIIGCGAVSELYHIPVALESEKVEIKFLVDKNIQRVKELANKFDITNISDDYKQVIGKVDAAILAVPHYLHAPIAIDLLNNGIHVLVEKPMALTLTECNSMISAAEQSGAVLAIALMRRFLHSTQFVKNIIENNIFGDIESFDFQEGRIYNWPVATDFFFNKKKAGGGVLVDTGPHTLDLLLWFLGDVDSFEYFDDNYGGIEADCKLKIIMKSGIKGVVELSRIRNLRNTAVIRNKLGEIHLSLSANNFISINTYGKKGINKLNQIKKEWDDSKQSVKDLFSAQLQDWLNSICNGNSPFVSGMEAKKSIELIEKCYANRKLIKYPW